MAQALLRNCLDVIVLSLVVSTTSVTLTKARIFRELREAATRGNARLHDLVHCPYCMSHWISLLLVAVYRPRLTHASLVIADDLVSMFAIVALATVWSKWICGSLQAMDSLTESGDDVP